MESTDFITTIKDSLFDLADSVISFVPRLVTALLIVIIGLFIAKMVMKLVKTVLKTVEENPIVQKFFEGIGIKIVHISDIAAMFARYAVLLIFVGTAVDVLGLDVLTSTFNQIIAYIPQIFAAVIVAGVTYIASNVVRDLVSEAAKKANIGAHKMLSGVSRIAVLIFGLPLAAAQLGLDLTIINNNITIIMGGIMLALGIAFGMGGREVAGKIVNNMYENNKR